MKRLLDASLVLAATCAAVAAQGPLYSLHGSDPGGGFGFNVRGVGDQDADGRPDFAIGAPFTDINGLVDTGMCRVYSGRTGLRLREYRGDRDLQELGYSVEGSRDIDGDGHEEFVFGVRVGRFRYPGEIWVCAGRNGRILFRHLGENSYDFFGSAIAGVGDVDSDGYGDLAVGAPGRDDIANNSGRVTLYSGRARTVLQQWYGAAANEDFGAAVSAAGDVDGDGYGDVVIGAPRADLLGRPDCGQVSVYSGKSGALLWSWHGDAADDRLGCSVDGAGDVNGDGVPDLIAGACQSDVGGSDSGQVKVFSGADGSVLWSWSGATAGDAFGLSASGAGDVDGDGLGDLVVGAPDFDGAAGADAGRTYLFSGASGALLASYDGQSAGAHFGFSVASAGDADGDGYFDVVIGAPDDVVNGAAVGSVAVYSLGGTGTPPRGWFREAGCPGSDRRQPRIDVVGRAALGESYELLLRGALPNAAVLMNLGIRWDMPLDPLAPGCVLHAYPLELFSAVSDLDGFARVTPFQSIPIDPVFIGYELHHQWLVVDPANNLLGLSASNDAVLVIGQ